MATLKNKYSKLWVMTTEHVVNTSCSDISQQANINGTEKSKRYKHSLRCYD